MCAFEPLRPESVLGFSGPSPGRVLCPHGARSGPLPVGRPCSTASRSRIPSPAAGFENFRGLSRPQLCPCGGRSGPVGVLRRWSTLWSGQGEAGGVDLPYTYPAVDRQTALHPEPNRRFTTPTRPLPTLQPAYPIVGSPALQSTYPIVGLPDTYPIPGRPRRTAPESRDLPYTYPTDPQPGGRAHVPRPTL